MRLVSIRLLPVVLVAGLLLATGCRSAYYRALEKLGKDKRELLVERVGKARDSQEEAKEQFKSTLEQFSSVVGYEGGELEQQYEALQAAFEDSEDAANEVHDRIDAIEHVSEALFDEWEDELEEYTDQRLRRASEKKLRETRARYEDLIRTMRRAEDKMAPVLDAFRDQVLFLKHNLNAQAIASLEGTVASLESDIASLVDEMEASIEEANRFIEAMQTS